MTERRVGEKLRKQNIERECINQPIVYFLSLYNLDVREEKCRKAFYLKV